MTNITHYMHITQRLESTSLKMNQFDFLSPSNYTLLSFRKRLKSHVFLTQTASSSISSIDHAVTCLYETKWGQLNS